MSTRIDYKNLQFMYSRNGGYIRSIFGQKNYKALTFSGIKTAVRPWGWQWRQFQHADSAYDVVYVRQRFSIRNHFNGSRAYTDGIFDRYNPTQHVATRTIDPNGVILPVGTSAYEPSKAAFEAGGGSIGSPSNLISSVTSPTLAQTIMVGSSPAGRYTADYENLEPISLAEVLGDVRNKIAEAPNPDYDDPTNTFLYSDNWGFTNSGTWVAASIKAVGFVPLDPYLLGFLEATQQLQDANTHALNYWRISAKKLGITIFNTRVNQLTIERYCSSQWTRTQAQDQTYSFSAHRNCQMFTNPPGPRPFNILVDLPIEDPLVQTNSVPVGTGSLGPNNPFAIRDKMVGNEFYFPGYPAAGYPISGQNLVLPPPGPCCILT